MNWGVWDICPGDICPHNFILVIFVRIFGTYKLLCNQNCFDLKNIFGPKFIDPGILLGPCIF